jgi:hypothetical protein
VKLRQSVILLRISPRAVNACGMHYLQLVKISFSKNRFQNMIFGSFISENCLYIN